MQRQRHGEDGQGPGGGAWDLLPCQQLFLQGQVLVWTTAIERHHVASALR